MEQFQTWLAQHGITQQKHRDAYARLAGEILAATQTTQLLPKHLDAYLQQLSQQGKSPKELANVQKVGQSLIKFQTEIFLATHSEGSSAQSQPKVSAAASDGVSGPSDAAVAAPLFRDTSAPSTSAPSTSADQHAPLPEFPERSRLNLPSRARLRGIAITVGLSLAVFVVKMSARRAARSALDTSSTATATPNEAQRLDPHSPLAKACAQNLAQMGASELQIRVECYNDPEARAASEQMNAREAQQKQAEADHRLAALHPVATADVKELRAALDGEPSPNGYARLQVSIMLRDANGNYVSAPGKVAITYSTHGDKGTFEQILKVSDFHPRKLHESLGLADVIAATLPRTIMVRGDELSQATYSVDVRYDDRLVTTAILNVKR